MNTSAKDFSEPVPDARLEALAVRLRERNFEVVIVDGPAEAKAEVRSIRRSRRRWRTSASSRS